MRNLRYIMHVINRFCWVRLSRVGSRRSLPPVLIPRQPSSFSTPKSGRLLTLAVKSASLAILYTVPVIRARITGRFTSKLPTPTPPYYTPTVSVFPNTLPKFFSEYLSPQYSCLSTGFASSYSYIAQLLGPLHRFLLFTRHSVHVQVP